MLLSHQSTVIGTSTKFNSTNATAAIAREWEYKGAFNEGAPTTSAHADDKDMAQDEIHVAVVMKMEIGQEQKEKF